MCPIFFERGDTSLGELEEIYPKLNLLGHAQILELSVGSQCGGHGICGADRVQVFASDPSALSELTEIENKHLSEDEIKNGFRLACQCFPEFSTSQLEIKVRVR
ncbi:MAG: 2Fe-2S iron-sulfur cluster binding domain-containing protein [Proteobacteria bacterium]|nr:MAG: 2Fe-2S iron-sulfur cluster binding domain-containing protein [Pseudomonadota bacterium]